MEIVYTGSLLGDFLYCKRKFFLITKGVQSPEKNDDLIIGKLIDKNSYPREERDVVLGRNIIDFIGDDGKIHEIKKSSSYIETHRMQLLYYLYVYKQMYGRQIEGVLNFPEERKKVEVILDDKEEKRIEDTLNEMKSVENGSFAPEISPMYKCRKCSLLEICRG